MHTVGRVGVVLHFENGSKTRMYAINKDGSYFDLGDGGVSVNSINLNMRLV